VCNFAATVQSEVRLGSAATSRSLAVVTEIEIVMAASLLLALAAVMLARRVWRLREERLRNIEEVRARAMMGELCPNGWHAQVTLYGSAPPDAPAGQPALVALDWSAQPADDGEPALTRRVWAATIPEALAGMVRDRHTDEVLERIEQSAIADDDPWDAL
jgi:hypothetical protein